MKDITLGFLSKTLNMDNEQLAELLYKKSDDGTLTDDVNENALSELLRLDAERVQKLKPDTKTFFDNGYRKAQAEIAGQWEKKLREKFGVDPDGSAQGDALLDSIKAAFADTQTKPEKIKAHPEYIALEAQLRKQAEDLKAEFEAEIQKRDQTYQREQTWGKVSGEIRTALKSLNPILPQDQAKADRMLELFVNTHFRDLEYQPDGNGGYVVMKDGQRVENQHGPVKALTDLVRETADSGFEFQAQKRAGNAGNSGGNGGATVNLKFGSETDYYKARQEAAGNPARLAEIAAAWRAQQTAGAN